MVTKICVGNYGGDIYHRANFIQIGLGVSVLRMRDFAPLKWLGYFFGFWEKLQPRRVHRFWRKIRQTTRFRPRKCLLGVAKPKSQVSTPIFPKNAIFGLYFDGTWNFFFAHDCLNFLSAHWLHGDVLLSNSAFFLFAVLVMWFSHSRPYKMF